jgi:hypothetical protein
MQKMINILQNSWLVFLMTLKVMGKNNRLGNCHKSEKPKKIRCLNAVWYPELDHGTEKGY